MGFVVIVTLLLLFTCARFLFKFRNLRRAKNADSANSESALLTANSAETHTRDSI